MPPIWLPSEHSLDWESRVREARIWEATRSCHHFGPAWNAHWTGSLESGRLDSGRQQARATDLALLRAVTDLGSRVWEARIWEATGSCHRFGSAWSTHWTGSLESGKLESGRLQARATDLAPLGTLTGLGI